MSNRPPRSPGSRAADLSWTDGELVAACREGREDAWSVLVDKYAQLVYRTALKYDARPEQAADLFQSIWLDAWNDLPKLRESEAFRGWLATLANHKCFHWKKRLRRREGVEIGGVEPELVDQYSAVAPSFAGELEREQLVRDAVARLDERCREMVRMLFFATPPLPYTQVAERLGLAVGSIGFIRGRCLERLQKWLEKAGL